MSTTLIAATQAAATGSTFSLNGGQVGQVWVGGSLGSEEAVTLERTADQSTWYPVTEQGQQAVLDSQSSSRMVTGPGVFRVRKTFTQSSLAIFLDT